MSKEAMEYLCDLKLHQEELEVEKKRLEHQTQRLDEEIRLLEEAVHKKMKEKKPHPPVLNEISLGWGDTIQDQIEFEKLMDW
tara:strand:- start:1819 stop:2064 length:246 start_codon:yes stop_codon:yes gene_type:complete